MLWASLRQKRITRSWPSFPKSSNASLTSGRPFITLLYIQWPRKSTLSPSGALAHKYDRRNPKQTGISMVTRNYQGWPTTNYLPLSFHLEVSMRHEQIGQGFRNRTVGFVKKKRKNIEMNDDATQYAINSQNREWSWSISFLLVRTIPFMNHIYENVAVVFR